MKNLVQNIFLIVVLCILCSCAKEQLQLPNAGCNTMDFVGFPTGFNDVNVLTKSTSTDFENTIHNSFLLIYNNEDRCIYYSGDLGANPQVRVTANLSGATKACFIANYPIARVRALANADLESLNSEVLSLDYAPHTDANAATNIGIPELDLDNDKKDVRCIPMFGQVDISNSTSAQIQIPIKRLLAKVTVNLSLNVVVDWNIGDIWSKTVFKLNSCTIKNLPTKVSLVEPTSDTYNSKWNTEQNLTKYSSPVGDNGITIENKNGDTNYSLTFYVPEYYLQPLTEDQYFSNGHPEGTYATQEYKPKMYDSEGSDAKYPICVDLQGLYDPTSGNEVKLKYSVFLGENETNSFTLKRNRHYTNQLTISGVRYSTTDEVYIDHRVETDPNLGLSENAGETANCYLICDEGTYYFPAVKGAFRGGAIKDEDYCNEGYVEIIARDNANIVIENYSYNHQDKTIVFDVTKVADGNVVIALKDNKGETQWSWHLWMNTGFSLFGAELTKFELDVHKLPNNYEMTQLNLGAKSATITLANQNDAIGPYYRYGYREPYFKNVEDNKYDYYGGLEVKSDWSGDTKSKTDPCPPGYRVPSTSAWEGFTPKKEHSWALGAFLFYEGGKSTLDPRDDFSIYYPYSGYVANKELKEGVEGGRKTKNMSKEIKFPNDQDLDRIRYNEPSSPPVKYNSISYNVVDIEMLGNLSSRDNKVWKYSYTEKGYELVQCTRLTGTWKAIEHGIFSKYYCYVADYSNSGAGTPISGTELETANNDHYKEITQQIKRDNEGLFGGLVDFFTKQADGDFVNIESDYGYQVRCVKLPEPAAQ